MSCRSGLHVETCLEASFNEHSKSSIFRSLSFFSVLSISERMAFRVLIISFLLLPLI